MILITVSIGVGELSAVGAVLEESVQCSGTETDLSACLRPNVRRLDIGCYEQLYAGAICDFQMSMCIFYKLDFNPFFFFFFFCRLHRRSGEIGWGDSVSRESRSVLQGNVGDSV